MKKDINKYVFGLSGAALGAGGLFFIILGLGCFLASAAALVMTFKKQSVLDFF